MTNERAVGRPTIDSLAELGFTPLEAEIYVYLLQHPPATGYRIAKGVGRTNANCYQAIASLAEKGAVLVGEGEPRLCRAVPPRELIAQLRRRRQRAEAAAEAALSRLGGPVADERVYQLTTREQVLERARSMIGRARHLVVADLYPTVAPELAPELVAAAQRGVRVAVKIYRELELPGVEIVFRREGQFLVDGMPGDHLGLNADGGEHLLATLRRPAGPPLAATWTASPVLAYSGYGSLIYELILTDLQQRIRDGADNAALREVLDRHAYLHPISSAGPIYRRFLEALGASELLARLPDPDDPPT